MARDAALLLPAGWLTGPTGAFLAKLQWSGDEGVAEHSLLLPPGGREGGQRRTDPFQSFFLE